MKQIIGIFLMIVQTVLGIVLCIGIATVINMNSDTVLKAVYKANYLETTSFAAKETLMGYMTEEKADEILKNISVKSEIKELVGAIDNNTVEKKAEAMKAEMNTKVVMSLEDDVDENLKEQFATIVSNAYMKTIFPISEMSLVSKYCALYKNKIILAVVVLALIYGIIFVALSKGRKTYKWQIISMYNVVIFTLIIFALLGTVTNITIGNERTSEVITNIIKNVRGDILIAVFVMILLAIISNYFAYFRKKKSKHS